MLCSEDNDTFIYSDLEYFIRRFETVSILKGLKS